MPDAIITRFDADASQWSLAFRARPAGCIRQRSAHAGAVRRLLEGTESSPPDTYELRCDADRAGSGVLHRSLIWDPPEMLFECSTCGGTGQYVGLAEVGTCEVPASQNRKLELVIVPIHNVRFGGDDMPPPFAIGKRQSKHVPAKSGPPIRPCSCVNSSIVAKMTECNCRTPNVSARRAPSAEITEITAFLWRRRQGRHVYLRLSAHRANVVA